MPRRRPVREQRTTLQISGVSAPAMRAIASYEHSPGAIARALTVWSRFVHGPLRVIASHEQGSLEWMCCDEDDPGWSRTVLRSALHGLPAKAARELRALVRPLDELYLTRSIPSPDTAFLRELLDP
ncbi:hypothetical protein [Lentzea sp. NPDC055074]